MRERILKLESAMKEIWGAMERVRSDLQTLRDQIQVARPDEVKQALGNPVNASESNVGKVGCGTSTRPAEWAEIADKNPVLNRTF